MNWETKKSCTTAIFWKGENQRRYFANVRIPIAERQKTTGGSKRGWRPSQGDLDPFGERKEKKRETSLCGPPEKNGRAFPVSGNPQKTAFRKT